MPKIKNKQKEYESECWGHRCEYFKETETLHQEIEKVFKKVSDVKGITYPTFLWKLRLLGSTPQHWKTCRPTNLKLLEMIKSFCNSTAEKVARKHPSLFIKFWEKTLEFVKEKEIEEIKTETEKEKLDTLIFGQGDDKNENKK